MEVKLIVACECSGVVRDAFAALGHDAWSCDLQPCERGGKHIQGDALEVLYGERWDMAICHPPCTYLANSGVRWLVIDGQIQPERWKQMVDGVEFFNACLNAPIERRVNENPVMHCHAKRLVGREHDQTYQPWMHGHGECKRTCLWLTGLPTLKPSRFVGGREQRVFKMAPGLNRQKERSRTLEGVAKAMAEQWGSWRRTLFAVTETIR